MYSVVFFCLAFLASGPGDLLVIRLHRGLVRDLGRL